ncbi:Uncharacterised protein [Mycobacterium tuberculosis]|uniref:Uncharacterized protein n=1 Tax=Mycobacterium tuberculosis TaxID=1773 RepID=A0A654TQT5_MYCTX|nr:Uncharacterised protein [Mycobacterium tuberculosis]
MKASTQYPGTIPNDTQCGASKITLGFGKATVSSMAPTMSPITFVTKMATVSMPWIRTRRIRGLSDTRPSSHEPYAGASGRRPVRGLRVSTAPGKCRVVAFSDGMVTSA